MQKDLLDRSIIHLTEALLFPPLSWLQLTPGPAILEVLYYLALSLSQRSRVSKEPEGAIYASKYFRHVRDSVHTPLGIQRQQVTASLAITLDLQMALKASDVVQTFEEMTALTQELLTSDPSSDHTTCAISCFANAVGRETSELSSPFMSPDLLNGIIKCLRLARVHRPELPEVHISLAACLVMHYCHTLNDELDEAAQIMDEMTTSTFPGDNDEFLAFCQNFIPALTMARSTVMDGHPENSEEAIYRGRAFLASSSTEDPLYSMWSHVLENAANKRFKNFGPVDGIEVSSSSDPLLPWREQGYVRPLEELLDRIPTNSVTDIEEAVELGRSILASSDPSDLQSSYEFCKILYEAFKRTRNIDYLNESIDTLHQILARQPVKMLRLDLIDDLLSSLFIRSSIYPGGHRMPMQDFQEIIELSPQFLDDASRLRSLPRQFRVAFLWACCAQSIQHQSTSMAYKTALSLMQDITLFSPTLHLQHDTLTNLLAYHEMPLAYTSYQVEQGQLEQAIETLERGRALLWSEMRHLRAPIDQLLDQHPKLGPEFAALNRDLEELTKSIAPSHKLNMDDVVANDFRAGDQFGSLLRRQRGLLKERDRLISEIRSLPGFDRFLTFPSFDALRSAASSGPVIIVNHSEPRSDILILLHNASPSIIPTPNDFHDRANALKDKLFDSRVRDGLDSSEYDQTLASVLAELYELVGKPVIDRLRQLQVPDQSRVWWCPTSVFCSLPLHAMGPIPSDDDERRYFLDLYICSYTPSLSALIQSRTRDSSSRSSDLPSILLVAPDLSLPNVKKEIKVVQDLHTEVTSLISAAATIGTAPPAVETPAETAPTPTPAPMPTPAAVLEGFKDHRFVHFACHGTLEANKPFEAGFELHGGKRLTLLEIVRADLPTAEFAFLSACHTAEVTKGSIADEGLHLAAAVQYAGFRSVVGTMWAMADVDGKDLAMNFYKALFSNFSQDQGIPYHESSAKALQSAVTELRKKRRKQRITLERWVNFVHYGA